MRKDYKRFLTILKDNPVLYDTAQKVLGKHQGALSLVGETTYSLTAPIMYLYTKWVLQSALNQGISRLYFLARDGFILYKTAVLICKQYHLDIECKYIYVSRYALRIPQYHLDMEVSMDKIFGNAANITLKKIFDRVAFDDRQISEVMNQVSIDIDQLHSQLNYTELKEVKQRFQACQVFQQMVMENSKKAYDSTIAYMKQEGLFDEIEYAIVDVGWIGTIQQSMEALVNSYRSKPIQLKGFYFGLYDTPDNMNPNNFNTFYFNSRNGLKRKVMFNNNIFECLCAANNGMTIGYETKNRMYIPMFSSEKNVNAGSWPIEEQINGVQEFAKEAVIVDTISRQANKRDMQIIYTLCKEFMCRPTKREAIEYGRFKFSDDITEKNLTSLAIEMTKEEIRENRLIYYILERMGSAGHTKISCWPEGSIVIAGGRETRWNQIDCILLRTIRYIKMNIKKVKR